MSESVPLVTVAMPLYNAAKYLPTSLLHVREQSYENLDIILCDNASTDETPAICEAAAVADPRIRYVRHARNLGALANFNACASLKRGSFFMWAAHDDVLGKEFVASTLAVLQARPGFLLAHAHTILISEDGTDIGTLNVYDERIGSADPATRVAAFLPQRYNVAFYGLMRSAALDWLSLLGSPTGADLEFTLSLLLRGPFAIVPRPLFRYRLVSTDASYSQMFQSHSSGDYILHRWKALRNVVRASPLPRGEQEAITGALERELRPMLDERGSFLLSQALQRGGRHELKEMFAWAIQYPPLWRSRFFWGAVRRMVVG